MEQSYAVQYKQIEAVYKKVIDNAKSNTLHKVSPKELKLQTNRIEKMMNDFENLESQGIDVSQLLFFQDKFVKLSKEYESALKNPTSKTEFSKKVNKILEQGNPDQTPDAPEVHHEPQKMPGKLPSHEDKKQQKRQERKPDKVHSSQLNVHAHTSDLKQNPNNGSLKNQLDTHISKLEQDKHVARKEVIQPAIDILSQQQLVKYENQLLSLQKHGRPVSFKSQIPDIPQNSYFKKKKFGSQIGQPHKNDIQFKSEMIKQLMHENNELKSKIIERSHEPEYHHVKQIHPIKEQLDNFDRVSHGSSNNQKVSNMKSPSYHERDQEIENLKRELELRDMKRQHEVKDLLEVEKYQVYNELLKKQNEQIYSKLHDLEQVLEELAKENMRLTEMERSGQRYTQNQVIVNQPPKYKEASGILANHSFSKLYDQKSLEQKDEYEKNQFNLAPYVLPIRTNDILRMNTPPVFEKPKSSIDNQKLDQRNSAVSQRSEKVRLSNLIESREKQYLPDDDRKSEIYKPYENNEYGLQNSFSTFKAQNSIHDSKLSMDDHHYSRKPYQNETILDRKLLKYTNKQLLLRNKVAFFKSSLVLLKGDPHFEIAYKRSQLNSDKDSCRFIFYVNNTTANQEKVDISYSYNFAIYGINTTEKLTKVKPHSQGREQILVTYRDFSNKLPFSFIVCHFTFAKVQYDIVLPILFVGFRKGDMRINESTAKTIIVTPDKQFGTPRHLEQFLPITYHQEYELEFLQGQKPHTCDLIVESRKNMLQGLQLSWSNGQLKIFGDSRYVQVLAWILSEVRL